MDPDDDTTVVSPPAELLPVPTLDEAHDLLGPLVDIRDGREPDQETARYLLTNLADRVPSREDQQT